MPSNSPAPPQFDGVPFDHLHRQGCAAALMSATPVIDVADGTRWTQRDLNELTSRGWAKPLRMRKDYRWVYIATETGLCVAESLRDEGIVFDGYGIWHPDWKVKGKRR